MNIPYMIGRRARFITTPASDQRDCRQHGRDTSGLRAEDNSGAALRTLGWSVATFGAGAILGWVASGNVRRKDG